MNENTLFYESFSCRYFRSNIDKVNTISAKAYMASMTYPDGLSINMLYKWLGLEKINIHDDIKWTNRNPCLLLTDDYIISPTGEVAIYVDHKNQPE